MNKTFLIILFAALSVNSVVAGTGWTGKTKIARTLSHAEGDYGGCMAQLESSNQSAICGGSHWYSFDCKGFYISAGSGKRAYATALSAFVAEKYVDMEVDNSRKANGYCLVTRIDMVK